MKMKIVCEHIVITDSTVYGVRTTQQSQRTNRTKNQNCQALEIKHKRTREIGAGGEERVLETNSQSKNEEEVEKVMCSHR